jgi:hypothetical protein
MSKKPIPADPAPTLGSLGDLLRDRGVSVAAPSAAPAPPPTKPAPGGLDLSRAGKLIVRRERKGHGGKTVTVVDGLAGSPAALDALAPPCARRSAAAHGSRTAASSAGRPPGRGGSVADAQRRAPGRRGN